MDAKKLVYRFYDEVAGDGRVELLPELLDDGFVLHGAPGGGDASGREPIARNVRTLRAAFDGLAFDVGDVLAEGDRLAARWTMRGTHTGEFYGRPGSGRPVEQSGMVFYRVADGRLAEQWIVTDVYGLFQQIAG